MRGLRGLAVLRVLRALRVLRGLPFVFVLFVALPLSAQTLEPVRYSVSFPAPQTHYVEVEASFPTEGRPQIDLMMPVWTPGSYLVREYARHVEAFTATDPARAPLGVEKTRKNRWRVTTNGAQTVWVRYRVYAHEMSVRTNWVDDEFALINGAPTFMTLLETRPRSHEVRVVLPPGWVQSLSGMPAGAAANTYVAADYDTLVDSPIVAGNPAVYEFAVSGKPHYLVDFRERGVWKGPQAVQDLSKAVAQVARLWGSLPYDRYYFFNIIGGPNNGLEHRNSTVINTPRESSTTRRAYLGWLSLATHEYFHTWNVKRLRPIELGPFDYENENPTKGLWFVEGVTDYYADLMLHRAGVSTRDEYIEDLSGAIRTLQTTPGRLVQSAEMASYDAWIKYYRPDENSDNTSISYYTKGEVIGFLLDARIRRATSGARSLDDLMRLMYQRYSGATGFTPGNLRAAAVEIVGPSSSDAMRAWLARVLETTQELDYAEALDWLGLRITPSAESPRAWLGATTRIDSERTIVTGILRGSPAFAAGLSLGDEIVAINGVAVAPGQLTARIGQLAPGTRIVLSISRRDTVRPIEIALGSDPGHNWMLSIMPVATAGQTDRLSAWLSQ